MEFHCRGCAHASPERWRGRCPFCGGYWNIKTNGGEKERASTLAAADGYVPPRRIATGIGEVDRVLGGGLVPGSTIVLTGPPGIGKSTLLLQAADGVARENRKVLFASGEQTADDVLSLAARLGIRNAHVEVLGLDGDVYKITHAVERHHAGLLIIDSLQTAALDDVDADEGSAEQCRAVANYLTAWSKRTGIAALVVSHINKDHELAGPKAIEHLVDGVVYFDMPDADDLDLRLLISGAKMRNGPSNVEAFLRMTERGLVPAPKSKLVLV